jgi:hypothetical protein
MVTISTLSETKRGAKRYAAVALLAFSGLSRRAIMRVWSE